MLKRFETFLATVFSALIAWRMPAPQAFLGVGFAGLLTFGSGRALLVSTRP